MNRKRIPAFLLCFSLILCIASASAASVAFPDLLSASSEEPVLVTVSEPELKACSGLDRDRLSLLNRLLRHLSMEMTLQGRISETSIKTDGQDSVSFIRQNIDQQVREIWSSVPESVLLFPDAFESAKRPETVSFITGIFTPCQFLLNGLYNSFAALPEHFPELVKTNEMQLNLSGYGRAVRRVNMNFPAESAAEDLQSFLAKTCEEENVKEILGGCIFTGAQKISLLYDQEDRLIRISYDGIAGFSEEDLRNISVTWKCLRNGSHQKDSLVFKSPSVNGTERYNIILDREIDPDNEKDPVWTWSFQIDAKKGKTRIPAAFTMSWVRNGDQYVGTMNHTVNQGAERKTVLLDALLTVKEDHSVSGGVEITVKKGKIETDRFAALLSFSRADELSWQEKPGIKTINAESSPEQAQEVYDRVYRDMLHSLILLPDEDLMFLTSGLADEEWKAILQPFRTLVSSDQ